MKTIQDILSSGTAYLEARGIDAPRHSMQSLLVHVLGCSKTWLYLHHEDHLSEEQLAPLRDLLRERGKGVPLQHLLGTTEFYRREFRTDARALIPRPETEELVEMALHTAKPHLGMRVLDMGCGSGIIGITLALELAPYKPEVVLADISDAALALTLENAAKLGAKVRTYRSDLFAAWAPQEDNPVVPPAEFNLVLANLPYVPDGEAVSAEVSHDPATALYGGADGLDIVRRFLTDALPYMAEGCLVMLEVGHDQGRRTAEIMRQLGYTDCRVLTDMSGKSRFPMGYAPRKSHEQQEAQA
ncbi:MAG: peptide chain release factor N(5)-glutamine methyltransferase [Akkermansiaceae bacterium]|nr:peptide chain release factor N(5)-glutamine methyltransferase [Akkermansiaceae bacterium]